MGVENHTTHLISRVLHARPLQFSFDHTHDAKCALGSLSFRAKPNCHSERTRTVIPSGPELSFRAKPNCHSERTRTVIPSGPELSFRAKPRNLTASHRDAASDSVTPLRSVQNDMTWSIRCHSERTRTVIPSEAELSFRAKPRNLTASHRDAASDSSLRCAPFRMT